MGCKSWQFFRDRHWHSNTGHPIDEWIDEWVDGNNIESTPPQSGAGKEEILKPYEVNPDEAYQAVVVERKHCLKAMDEYAHELQKEIERLKKERDEVVKIAYRMDSGTALGLDEWAENYIQPILKQLK